MGDSAYPRGVCGVESSTPAFSPAPPSVEQRLEVLDLVLTSCARQRIRFEEAWRIATPIAFHGLNDNEDAALVDELRQLFAAEPFRARVADLYAGRVRRSERIETGALGVR